MPLETLFSALIKAPEPLGIKRSYSATAQLESLTAMSAS